MNFDEVFSTEPQSKAEVPYADLKKKFYIAFGLIMAGAVISGLFGPIGGLLILIGVWKSAGLSNELHWNYWHKDYSIEVNDSTFELEMDLREKEFTISFYEKPYEVGYYSGCFMETGYNEYSLFVDTMYSVKKDLFHFSFRNDTLINFRPKPIKIERTSIEVNSFFVDE